MKANFHEHYVPEGVPLPSERSTGFVFVAVLLIVAYLIRGHPPAAAIALLLAAILLALSLLASHLLKPLNILWFRFALLLNKIMSPIIMFVLFAATIVPFGLVMQLIRDPLRKRRDSSASSYWIERQPHENTGSMTNQF